MTLNAVLSSEPPTPDGYPVLLQIRRILEDAADFDAALKALSEQPLTTSALLTLVGTDNDQRVVIERTATRSALRWPDGDAPLITTNDYRELAKPRTSDEVEIYETTCSRFDYLTAFLKTTRRTPRPPTITCCTLSQSHPSSSPSPLSTSLCIRAAVACSCLCPRGT